MAIRNSYTNAIRDAKPISYWRMNQSPTAVIGDVMGSHDLTVVGVPMFDQPGHVADLAANSMSGWPIHLVPVTQTMAATSRARPIDARLRQARIKAARLALKPTVGRRHLKDELAVLLSAPVGVDTP